MGTIGDLAKLARALTSGDNNFSPLFKNQSTLKRFTLLQVFTDQQRFLKISMVFLQVSMALELLAMGVILLIAQLCCNLILLVGL